MQEEHTDLAVGELVRARGRAWRITRVRRYETCALLHLAAAEGSDHPRSCALLHPFDRLERPSKRTRLRVVSRRAFVHALADAAWHAHPWDALRAAAGARIALYPYQLEPALAVVRGAATRVLLADDVGLGKTIQAGLILAELVARGLARRALVLTPPGLREQWAAELDRRFGIEAAIADAAHVAGAVARVPRGLNPWALDGVSIASYDFIKRPEVARAVEALAWDLVIVDEAHAVAGQSDRHHAADGLCRRARRVVLLTATPHAGDDRSFAALCALGQDRDADDCLLAFHRTRAQVGFTTSRRVTLLPVTPTAAERRMHRLLERYTRAVWREAGDGAGNEARLAMIVLRKRALSSAASLAISVERRRDLLEKGVPDRASQLRLPLDGDGETEDEDDAPDAVLAAPGLADQARERIWLDALAAAARAAAADERKLAALVRLLRRTREAVIVFTEYRDTLERIAAAIRDLATVALLHGALTRQERAAALSRFDRGEARVLVATDTAGEGLNLQARCRWVIDFELPWTPARLEQRIGRVDRLGQTRRVHALHLVARDTAEALVVSRLLARARRARRTLGADDRTPALPEEAIAALVMEGAHRPEGLGHPGREVSSIPEGLGHPDRTSLAPEGPSRRAHPTPHPAFVRRPRLCAEAEAESARLSTLRALARLARPGSDEIGPSSRLGDDAPLASALGPGRRRRAVSSRALGAVVLLYRCAIVDAMDRPIDTRLLPIRLDVRRTARRPTAAELRALIEDARRAWAGDVEARLVQMMHARLEAIAGRHRESLAGPRARERAIECAVGSSLARSLVQPGLFDRRAVARAERERRDASAAHEETAARLRDLEAGRRLSVGRVELVLAAAFAHLDRPAPPDAGEAAP